MIPISKQIKTSATVVLVIALTFFTASAPSFGQLNGTVRVSTAPTTVKRVPTGAEQSSAQADTYQHAPKQGDEKKKPRKNTGAHGNQFPFQVTAE